MPNPAKYLIHEDQLKTVRSIRDIYGDGRFYTMDYAADHRLEDILAAGAGTSDELFAAVRKYLVAARLPRPSMGAGCSAFMAKNKEGHVLVGRNFDFNHDMVTMLISTAPEKCFKTLGMADLAFAEIKPGQLTDGETDLTPAMMFPYVTMDGINEKGFFIGVLQLRKVETYQNTGRKKITTSVAIRASLDKAETVQDAIDIFGSYDMQTARPGNDFHFFIADAKGDSAVIEYFQGKMNVLKTDHVTNFFLSPGARKKGVGKERYKVLDALLSYREGTLEKEDMMYVLKLISQPSGAKGKSNTLWSAVYDLTDRTLDLVVDHRYDDVRHYSLKDKKL